MQMWPKQVDWQDIKFGVEIEFVGGDPEAVELLPGWTMALDELQIDETGSESGSELQTPPLLWKEREQILKMLTRLKEQGARVNWSCGLHVHVSLEAWGSDILLPFLEGALKCQDALQELLRIGDHRQIFCPPVTQEMVQKFMLHSNESSLRHQGRPQSHRCGINLSSWFDICTVEIRYANGSLDYQEILNTIECCLRFVSAIGSNKQLSSKPLELAKEIGAPPEGYPAPLSVPQWFKERTWQEEILTPILHSYVTELIPDGEIHHILPRPEGFLVAVESSDEKLHKFLFQPPSIGWKVLGYSEKV